MGDFVVVIRTICQELYENLRHNHSIFPGLKAEMQIRKLRIINKKTDYMYNQLIRDEIGLVHKNYMVFCKKQEYDNNIYIMKKILKFYKELSLKAEQFLIGKQQLLTIKEYKEVEKTIKTLDATYGGQTEKYLKKLAKKKIGLQDKDIRKIINDKSKIISEKKRTIMEILQRKIDIWNGNYIVEKNLGIEYDYKNAEYILTKIKDGAVVSRRRLRFNTNFSDINVLREKALKKLKQLNFNVDIYKELEVSKSAVKYMDPFILTILCNENYLDYAKLYLRLVSGVTTVNKDQLPFKINYKVSMNFSSGKMTPVRNEIIAIIAERSALTVANTEYIKDVEVRVKTRNKKLYRVV